MADRSQCFEPCGLHRAPAGASGLSQRVLHASPSVQIHDVRCRAHDLARAPDEVSLSHQVVFPRRGVFAREVRGERCLADATQVLFFTRGEAYRVTHPLGGGDDCTVFTFDDAVLRDAVARCDRRRADQPDAPFPHTHAPSAARAFLLHAQLRRAAEAQDRLALDVASLELLSSALQSVYRDRPVTQRRVRAATARQHREQAERAKLLLSARLGEDLTLDALARAVYASPYHLMRVFRRETGLSLHQYRMRLRLAAALERVAAGEPNLSALACELGFASHAHLTDSFQRAFGVTPSACRKRASSALLLALSTKLASGPAA